MKKLNDEAVAKALGWTNIKPTGKAWPEFRGTMPYGRNKYVPSYTRNLSAIVAEIEAMELGYTIMAPSKGSCAWPEKGKPEFSAAVYSSILFQAKTAPLALCHALLAYLKENL